jgi:hypothetical protein
MLERVFRGALILACVSFVAGPTAARPPKGGGNQGGSSNECATASIALSGDVAKSGVDTVGIYGPVTNCSPRKDRLDVVDTFTSSCGVISTISKGTVRFDPLESILVSSSFPVPSNTCPGTATVTRTVYGSGVLASDTAFFEVLEP